MPVRDLESAALPSNCPLPWAYNCRSIGSTARSPLVFRGLRASGGRTLVQVHPPLTQRRQSLFEASGEAAPVASLRPPVRGNLLVSPQVATSENQLPGTRKVADVAAACGVGNSRRCAGGVVWSSEREGGSPVSMIRSRVRSHGQCSNDRNCRNETKVPRRSRVDARRRK